jgi:hypothetical protein
VGKNGLLVACLTLNELFDGLIHGSSELAADAFIDVYILDPSLDHHNFTMTYLVSFGRSSGRLRT